MSREILFNFIGSVWHNLNSHDKQLFGELWQGYEQVFATVYQLMLENDLNIAVQDMVPYQIQRWLKYNFDPTKAIVRNPTYTAKQDLSVGVRTDTKYLLKFRLDGTRIVDVDIRGLNPNITTLPEIVSKINSAAGFNFARGIYDNTIIQLVSDTGGVNSGIEILETSDNNKNACEYVLGILPDGLPFKVIYYPYAYPLPYDRVINIPDLRTDIRDETEGSKILLYDTDFIIDAGYVLAFKHLPPLILWGKKNYVNQETPWNNFGFLMGIYQPNTSTYLSVIQGLWHAFWVGPRPQSIQTSLYLLFGLPVAHEDCIVKSVSATEIITISSTGLIRSYPVAPELVPIVSIGQMVHKYDPLVSGIDVFDKINLPGFITTEIGRIGIQGFLTENATHGTGDTDETKALRLLEEHTFLPQISVNAFVSQDINLGNVKRFLTAIRPLHKTFLSQIIVGEFKDKLELKDRIGFDIDIDVTPNLDSNQTTFLDSTSLSDYETIDNEGLNLDSDVALLQERVEIEVRSFGVLIDSFTA
jgi:hypothetical protein